MTKFYCNTDKINAWWDFTDDEIIEMGGEKALIFWRKHKDLIKMTVELSPARKTTTDGDVRK